MNKSLPIVSMRNVGLSFGKLVVHRDLSFDIYQGDSVTILGPSGSGKTVILKLLIGLLDPSHGSVEVFQRSVPERSEEDLVKLRKRVGILFQGAALFDSLSVFENIAYSLREREDYSEEHITEIVHEKLDVVGLPGIDDKFPPQLSGGQKKRVGLARALASSPEIMLFDEPTTGLDPTSIRRIDDLIVRLNTEFGVTCISVTHDIESARRISNRWILLNNGVVLADGEVEELLAHNREVQNFVSGDWRDEDRVRG